MIINFKNKVVLISGSTRNIGKCIAENFAKNNATVIINSRQKTDVSSVVKEFNKKEYSCLGIVADVSKFKEAQIMVDKIISKYKKVDILINNAAIWYPIAAKNINERIWAKTIATNLTGVFNCCKAVYPDMQRQKSGKIISIGSESTRMGAQLADASYIASKFGIIGLTRQLAKEWGRCHININMVSVSPIDNQNDHLAKKYKKLFDRAISQTPIGRLAKPQDVANLVLFLSSKQASFITGQIFSINGGLI